MGIKQAEKLITKNYLIAKLSQKKKDEEKQLSYLDKLIMMKEKGYKLEYADNIYARRRIYLQALISIYPISSDD